MNTPPVARPMTLDEFVPLLGRVFEVDCAPKTALLTLIEAKPGRWPMEGMPQPFVLLFRSAPDVLLISAIFAMQCGSFGPALIHINPVTMPPNVAPGLYYEAVFN